MKKLNKSIIAVMLMAMVLAGCGENSETSENSKEISENISAEVETEEETTEEITVRDYSEAKAKIEELQAKVDDYSPFCEREGTRATIIMTEYLKDDGREPYSNWHFYAVNYDDQVCYDNSMYSNTPGSCTASPDGDTRYYTFFTGICGTYTFYATYYNTEYDVYGYFESEPVVIDESTLIEDTTFYSDRTTSSYYFNFTNLIGGDAPYEMAMATLDAKLAEGTITEEEYEQKKVKYIEYYKG